MRKETEYILGEVEHLLSYGLKTEYICKTLKRKHDAIAKMAERHGRPDIARPFRRKDKG